MSDLLSPVILNRIPDYIQDNYPEYTQFLTDYILFLESDQQFLNILEGWKSNTNVMNGVEPYITMTLKDRGFDIDKLTTVNKTFLIQGLREFFLSRGTPNSFSFLFQALFGATCEIRYPREQLLVPSAATYQSVSHIYLRADTWIGTNEFNFIINNASMLGGQAKGSASGVVTDIQSATLMYVNSMPILDLVVSAPKSEYIEDEIVVVTVQGQSISENVVAIALVTVTNPGTNYKLNDRIVLTSDDGNAGAYLVSALQATGINALSIIDGGCGFSVGDHVTAQHDVNDLGNGFSAYVTSVDSNGAITGVSVYTPGYSYASEPTYNVGRVTNCFPSFKSANSSVGGIKATSVLIPYLLITNGVVPDIAIQTKTGSGASISINRQTRFVQQSWADDTGFLGTNSTTLDSNKYQVFSYQIVSDVDPKLYSKFVTSLLHPVGTVRTSIVTIQSAQTLNIGAATIVSKANNIALKNVVLSYNMGDATITQQASPNYIAAIDPEGDQIPIVTADNVIVWQ